MINEMPVLSICGHSNAGKTTLILKVIEVLCTQRNLAVAVLKNDVHGLNIDKPGKDSDRLFHAGADVFVRGPQQTFHRIHSLHFHDFYARLRDLTEQYDFILVEGHKNMPLPKIWLLGDGESTPPNGVDTILEVLGRDVERLQPTLYHVEQRLRIHRDQTYVYGAVMIGGRSERMGQPKHLLLRDDGVTCLEHIVTCLNTVCREIVICGNGEVPSSFLQYPQLPDPPDVKGPMAGILAAMRWRPGMQWLVAACDLPYLSVAALEWLLSQCEPGVWGIVPRLKDAPGVEPLFAYYDGRCRRLFEGLAAQGNYRPLPVTEHKRVLIPTIPKHLAQAWYNVNRPEDLL